MNLHHRFTIVWGLALGLAFATPALAQTTPPPTLPPKPAPFPGSTPPPTPTTKPATPAGAQTPASPQEGSLLDPRLAGVPIYPNAELLESFDAGRDQHVFVFGTNMPYADIVAYYKTALRTSGNEIFRAPATQQFDLGPFRSDSMAYRPSVVIKDYTWMESAGYLHVAGTTEKRFRTLIQIVPAGK